MRRKIIIVLRLLHEFTPSIISLLERVEEEGGINGRLKNINEIELNEPLEPNH